MCFLFMDKHQSFLQDGTIDYGGCDQACPKYKNNKFANISNISKKRWGINMFCIKINIKVFNKLTVLFSMVIARYAQSTQNSMFIIILQYFKKEWRDEVYFFIQINIKPSYRLILLILVGMARHAQIT